MKIEPIKVLLIEDNPSDVRMIREMLRKVGVSRFDLVSANRLAVGLETLTREEIGLILLDLNLPDSQGFETFSRIYSRFPGVPIIVLTGITDEALALRAVREGAQDYLIKGELAANLLVRAMYYAIERQRAEEAKATAQRRTLELKAKLETQLHRAQKMEAIATLTEGIAHDFSKILSTALEYIDLTFLALHQEPDYAQITAHLKEVMKAVIQAQELVRQIPTFSRKLEPDNKPIEIYPIINRALKILRASLPAAIEIRQHLNPASGIIWADPTQIHQIVMHLCSNAIYAMRERGGILEITLDAVEVDAELSKSHLQLHEGSYLRLTVSDTGHGIEPSIRERIFEPYFTTKGPGEGDGLGLAIVHSIVESLDGAVTVESEVGQGTTFQVYFSRPDRGVVR